MAFLSNVTSLACEQFVEVSSRYIDKALSICDRSDLVWVNYIWYWEEMVRIAWLEQKRGGEKKMYISNNCYFCYLLGNENAISKPQSRSLYSGCWRSKNPPSEVGIMYFSIKKACVNNFGLISQEKSDRCDCVVWNIFHRALQDLSLGGVSESKEIKCFMEE